MHVFHLIFAAVLALTVLSGSVAVVLAISGNSRSSARRHVIERLSQVALMGASAIIALLSRFGGG